MPGYPPSHPVRRVFGQLGTSAYGAKFQAEWLNDKLTVTLLPGAGIRNLLSLGQKAFALRLPEEVTSVSGASVTPYRAKPTGWGHLLSKVGGSGIEVGIREIETSLSGHLSAQAVRMSWGRNQLELTATPSAAGVTLAGDLSYAPSLFAQRRSSVQLFANQQELNGRIGLPHPKAGKDVALWGTLTPSAMGLVACLVYALLEHETDQVI